MYYCCIFCFCGPASSFFLAQTYSFGSGTLKFYSVIAFNLSCFEFCSMLLTLFFFFCIVIFRVLCLQVVSCTCLLAFLLDSCETVHQSRSPCLNAVPTNNFTTQTTNVHWTLHNSQLLDSLSQVLCLSSPFSFWLFI